MKLRIALTLALFIGLFFVGTASAAPPVPATVTLASPTEVHHGDTVTFAVDFGDARLRGVPYTLTRCYNPDFIYAAYFAVTDGTSVAGPLDSYLWPSGGADCITELGYFARDGFGRWVILATTTFEVLA